MLLVFVAPIAQQQIVEDAHDAHQQQEAEDPFPKQIARRAAKERSIKSLGSMIVNAPSVQ